MLIVLLSVFFCSCEKNTENPYVPEVLEDDMHSRAGYARNFTAGGGELIFTVFRIGGSIWEVVDVNVQFTSGMNTVSISRSDGDKTGMWIDYIEIQ